MAAIQMSTFPETPDARSDDQYITQSRAKLYGILGHSFSRELTPEFAQELADIGFLEALANAAPDAAFASNPRALNLEALAVEYARLFVVPGPQTPPYASVYRTDDNRAGELWGETTGEVKRFMAHYGLELGKSGVIPDHISILFEFMEKLLWAKIEVQQQNDFNAVAEADKIITQFFTRYIAPWVETFLLRIFKAKPLPFYSAIVSFTREFIAQEKVVLGNGF